MQQYYQHDPEREPLDNPYLGGHSPGGYNNHEQGYGHHDQFDSTPTRGGGNRYGPGAHPNSQFNQHNLPPQDQPYAADYHQQDYRQPPTPSRNDYNQPPPQQRSADPRYYPTHGANAPSNITPGADNFSDAASGGMAGIAYTVADRNARESGMEAMRNGGPYEGGRGGGYSDPNYPPPAHQGGYGQNNPYDNGMQANPNENPFAGGSSHGGSSHSSLAPVGAAAIPGRRSPHDGYGHDPYTDYPYQGYRREDPRLGIVNPNEIADDGDEGLEYRRPARTSMLSLHSNRSGRNGHGAAATAGAVGAVGAAGVVGGLMGKNRNSGAHYDAVHNGAPSVSNGAGAGAGASGAGTGTGTGTGTGMRPNASDILAEKESEWLAKQAGGRKKWKWAISILVVLIILGAVAGGVVGGLVMKNKKGLSAEEDEAANGDLGLGSDGIKDLLNNKALHKVFPGMDYTPLNTQYPECDKYPPSQNNITRDIAVLSQLTNTVRLYGTDCNQTQMVVHAIQRLKLEDTMKVWIGVWQDNNATTNERQLQQMWDILDEYGADPFAGVIVANEILFREQMTVSALGLLLDSVRTNLTNKGIDLPVATSDLGDKLDSTIAQNSDYIMANIHPFFAGVNVKDAAGWTYSFWENQNKPLWKSDMKKNIIAEVGWPSKGGTNCGDGTVTGCPDASVAGVEEMNTLLQDWVCQALQNGTEYFWFSAFDEPWKVRFNEKGKEWEDQWGLMDVNRNLKDGVTIPDCGGQTID